MTEAFSFAKAPRLPMATLGGFAGSSASIVGADYTTAVREGYTQNDIVASAVRLLERTASEPRIIGRRYPSATARSQAKAYYRWADATGYPRWAAADVLSRKQLQEDLSEHTHPLPRLLNHPNPFTTRARLWGTVLNDRCLAGNSYLVKYREQQTWEGKRLVQSGEPKELWRMRPDRVRVVPDRERFIAGYVYKAGSEEIELAPEDVIHFKTIHPLDDYYGMPLITPVAGRVDIDNYMSAFVRAFFRRGGQPGAILSIKQKLSQESKDDLRERYRSQFGGGNWFEVMILDNADASYTPMTMQLGQRGLVVPELNAITEARIAMAFGIPASILGLLVGMESSSYANKRADWQVLWDVTLAPLYSELDDVVGMSLLPDFSGIDEVLFDTSQIKALQEDVDKLHERARKNVTAVLWTREEGRLLTGVEAVATEGWYLLPLNVMPMRAGGAADVTPQELMVRLAMANTGLLSAPQEPQPEPEPETRLGRPRIESDPVARHLYEQGEELRRRYPGMTVEQVAGRLGLAPSTYKRYRSVFREEESDGGER